MAKKDTPSVESRERRHDIISTLVSAFLEWLLMFMLLLDACFSYIITRFAYYSKLQVPCLLCSRIDRSLGNAKKKFYWDLICRNHKLEISSMVFCRMHNKLAGVHGMCEDCLFSFAINNSNVESYRLLVGKMGVGPIYEIDEDQRFEEYEHGLSIRKRCSCCDSRYREYDPLSHMEENAKVKITSETESEDVFHKIGDDNAIVSETNSIKDGTGIHRVQEEPRIITSPRDLTSEKLIHLDSVSESEVPLDVEDSSLRSPHIASHTTVGRGLDESTRNLKLSDEVELSSDVLAPHCEEVTTSSALEKKVDSEDGVICAIQSSPGKSSETIVSPVAGDDMEEISKLRDSPVARTDTIAGETSQPLPNDLDFGGAYKLAVGSKGRQMSGKFLQQLSQKESSRMSGDLKLMLSQLSSNRGFDLPPFEMSPRFSGLGDESKFDSSSSMLQRRISLERNESNLSLDGSVVSDIEGETEIERLKRQVEHDKKLMYNLYRDLEEERNASAVATNQAMAMITKLQEDKAAVQMEALQCIRVMEEQAEYDVEALNRTNDLLTDKEKEVQDLEEELEYYKNRFGDVSELDNDEPLS
ncbi:myosin-binding protein 1-like isoform X2 [Impatiens glandulifera]|uniref:myosin-binding protein 1-like isoform X2 n=1 Tax=Impatiens glandulifera TaxID=253017 RepID=UPI001FB19DE4|nr:myosin-binding protein 1-like isoform X2 [Impatiens glandulifera]